MSKKGKLLLRFLSLPNNFTWAELVTLLGYFGFEELKNGKTGGSRRKFADAQKKIIILHKPHPGNIVKEYALKQVMEYLIDNGHIK